MCGFVASLQLPALVVDAFRENAVDGEGLEALSRDDMAAELGMKKLQIDKLVRNLDRARLATTPTSGSPTACSTLERENTLALLT